MISKGFSDGFEGVLQGGLIQDLDCVEEARGQHEGGAQKAKDSNMQNLYAVVAHLQDKNVPANLATYSDAEGRRARPHASGIAVGRDLFALSIPSSDRDHSPVRILRWDRSLGWVLITDTHRDGHWRVRIAHAIKADVETRAALKRETKRMTTMTYFGESRRSAWV